MSTAAKLAILAVVLGMFFRIYQPLTRLSYGHDTDLASWVIKDIVFDGHQRLIGQLTTAPGIFIGSFTYYAQIPAYWLAHWDPAGNLLWSWLVSLVSLASIFWVTYKLYGKKAALATTLMFAVSFDISRTERVAVPTAAAFIWTSWFYYFLYRLYHGDGKSLYGLAILFALIWHINLALGLLFPLVLLGIILNTKNLRLKHLVFSCVLGLVLISPLLLFEVRHNFQQTHAILGGDQGRFSADKFVHTLAYAARNMNEAYWNRPEKISIWVLPLLFVIGVIGLMWKKIYSKTWLLVILVWYGVFLSFFTFNPINLSEYYLHGLSIVWIMTFGLVVSRLNIKLAVAILSILILINLQRLLSFTTDGNAYLQHKQITEFINQDAKGHGYDCVAVSYMTGLGYNFGYRYFFYRLGLHVNQPASNSPVYTIVFPQHLANRVDYTFGALGLVLPDYSRYTPEGVKKSCAGPDENVTGSMFGFTK